MPYRKRLPLSVFLLLLFLIPFAATNAQTENLTKDEPFFKEQADLYQKWLNHSGLGKILKVHALEVNPKELSLYLSFNTEDTDLVIAQWEQLKSDFTKQHSLSLEQQLFYKMIHLMEIRQGIGNVQLYDTYDLKLEPCFYVGIYFEDGVVRVDSSGCKSKVRKIAIDPSDLGNMKKVAVADFKKQFDKTTVFNKIYNYAEKKFQKEVCQNRYPKVRLRESKENLRFEVIDLCREVLTDAANPTLCRLLQTIGYDCNWVKREKLDFIITYNNTPTGFELNLTIDGKYGSGYYEKVERGGYISMEIDFDEYLEVYADEFSEKLRRVILFDKNP